MDGKNAKTILPLLALGAIGVASGGFGLFGSAGASGAAAGGVTAGTTAATTALSGPLAGVALTPAQAVGAGAAGGSLAATPVATTALSGPLAGVPLSAAQAAGSGVTPGTIWAPAAAGALAPGAGPGAGMFGFFNSLSTFEKLSLGLSALSGGAMVQGAQQQGEAREVALATQLEDAKAQRVFSELELVSRQNEIEARRERALASIANSPLSSGARERLAIATDGAATGEMGLLRAESSLAAQRTRNRLTGLRNRRRLAGRSGAVAAIGGLLDFGIRGVNVLERRFT